MLTHITHSYQQLTDQQFSASHGRTGPPANTRLLGITRASLPNGISFCPMALPTVHYCDRHTCTDRHTDRQTDRQTDRHAGRHTGGKCYSNICCNRQHYHFQQWLGLPDIPYFTGAPVFQPQSPASRNEATREIKSPVFGHSPRPAKSHASRVSLTHFHLGLTCAFPQA